MVSMDLRCAVLRLMLVVASSIHYMSAFALELYTGEKPNFPARCGLCVNSDSKKVSYYQL